LLLIVLLVVLGISSSSSIVTAIAIAIVNANDTAAVAVAVTVIPSNERKERRSTCRGIVASEAVTVTVKRLIAVNVDVVVVVVDRNSFGYCSLYH